MARIDPSFRACCVGPFLYMLYMYVGSQNVLCVLRFFAIGMEQAVTVYTTVQSCVTLQPAAMFTNRRQMSLSIERNMLPPNSE